jgi:hypothetical protein
VRNALPFDFAGYPSSPPRAVLEAVLSRAEIQNELLKSDAKKIILDTEQYSTFFS